MQNYFLKAAEQQLREACSFPQAEPVTVHLGPFEAQAVVQELNRLRKLEGPPPQKQPERKEIKLISNSELQQVAAMICDCSGWNEAYARHFILLLAEALVK